jgi:E3 ubiquitin-protein ligase TRIP12
MADDGACESRAQQVDEEIANLCLDFTLPGHPDVELIGEGSTLAVNLSNIVAYIEMVRMHHIVCGVEQQMNCMYSGINEVLPISHMQLFSRTELSEMLFGRIDQCGRIWSRKADLISDIVCDHGYTIESRPVIMLVDVIVAWPTNLQRKFLAFISGSPRMPLSGLSPKLTIVKRDAVDSPLNTSPDRYLPTCNTCFHYLKLPEYLNSTALAEKLLMAISDGQESFDLS